MKNSQVKAVVKDGYAEIAKSSDGCGCACSCKQTKANDVSKMIGYSEGEMSAVPEGANMGLGCGNPTAIGEINDGELVLDLGSGAGFDVFLAARKVGTKGRVIGVDMTPEMIEKAEAIAVKGGYENVDFRLGDIEDLPVEDEAVDVVISNCVINLAPDKSKVFEEAYRVLKTGGRLYVSDIVLLSELTEEQKGDKELLTGCVAGAVLVDEYLHMLEDAGFEVKDKLENKDISKEQYEGMPVESLQVSAIKK